LQKQSKIGSMLKQLNGRIQPYLLFRQGIFNVVSQGLDFKSIDPLGVFQADAMASQIMDSFKLLRPPLPALSTRAICPKTACGHYAVSQ
jgi:hypothetical protein